MRRLVCLSLLLPLAAPPRPVLAASPCVAAVAVPEVAALPDVWRVAVARLVQSTAVPGHPWSCSGGTIGLRLEQERATLVVARRGEPAVERALSHVDDLVPLGQALLSLPSDVVPPAESVAVPAPQPAVSMAAPPARVVTAPAKDRVVVGATLAARLAGGANAVLLGGGILAAKPLGQWLPSVQLRAHTALEGRSAGLHEFALMAGHARVFAWPVVALRTGLQLSGVVLQRNMPRPARDEVRVDLRVGAVAAVVVAVRQPVRLVVGVEADWAPGRAPQGPASGPAGDRKLPFPFYTAGATVGVEVGL